MTNAQLRDLDEYLTTPPYEYDERWLRDDEALRCSICEKRVAVGDWFACEYCGLGGCEECLPQCGECGVKLCKDCLSSCKECGQNSCEACLPYCEDCLQDAKNSIEI